MVEARFVSRELQHALGGAGDAQRAVGAAEVVLLETIVVADAAVADGSEVAQKLFVAGPDEARPPELPGVVDEPTAVGDGVLGDDQHPVGNENEREIESPSRKGGELV